MDAKQSEKLIFQIKEINEDLVEVLERIAESLETIAAAEGAIANSALQLSDRHGSDVPGPF
jgi:hypothetical protein